MLRKNISSAKVKYENYKEIRWCNEIILKCITRNILGNYCFTSPTRSAVGTVHLRFVYERVFCFHLRNHAMAQDTLLPCVSLQRCSANVGTANEMGKQMNKSKAMRCVIARNSWIN